MKIDFSKAILDIKGRPLDQGGGLYAEGGELMTLASVAASALLTDKGDKVPPGTKLRRFKLALEIVDATSALDLKAEQVVEIKQCIEDIFPPVIVGRAFEVIGD